MKADVAEPAAAQEGSDCLWALEAVTDRLDALQRHQLLDAQTTSHMEEHCSAPIAKFEGTMQRTIKERSSKCCRVHARQNKGHQDWKANFTEYDAKSTELEQVLAHRNSRIEMLQGMRQRMARGETLPLAHGSNQEAAQSTNHHESFLLSSPIVALAPVGSLRCPAHAERRTFPERADRGQSCG